MFDLEYISELLQALLLAILPILAAQGAALLFAAYKAKRAELSDRQKWALDQVINIAVLAAQQLYTHAEGEEKKDYALSVVEQWVAKSGLTIDAHLLDAQIEAAVFAQLKRDFPPALEVEG